ncbi:MAG: class A beta-lactamase [Pseudolabrys sp.]
MPFDRRTLLLAAAVLPFAPALAAGKRGAPRNAERRIAEIEKKAGGRLGIFVRDSGNGAELAHRAHERFAMCSTFKFLAAAAVLKKVDAGELRLDQEIAYGEKDVLEYAPEAKKHVADGHMRLGDLCAAAIQWSDNTAANLILKEIGGPAGFTRYARAIGDKVTRLDRTEPTLNSAIPGDPRDTTTPAAIAHTLETVLTKGALSAASARQLEDWMIGDKVADARLRAGLPKDWGIGDKTGTGDNGTANTVAIIRPPSRKPLFAAVYLTQAKGTPAERNAVHADVARVIADTFAT